MRGGVPARGVTFDCWSTLVYECDPGAAHARRVAAVADAARAGRRSASEERARDALDRAWSRHLDLWQQGIACGAREMAAWALEELAVDTDADPLAAALAEASLAGQVVALEGARESLERLADAGVRRALICDTGFSPGRVVRRLLERLDLLALLEVQVFSDELGVPKPHPRAFETALDALGLAPEQAIHVGDLRRTDVAGARGCGMGTVRLRSHHDDRSTHPEADHVADSHAQLRSILGVA